MPQMKTKNVIAIAFVAVVVLGCCALIYNSRIQLAKDQASMELPDLSKPVTAWNGAEREIRDQLTNDVVGLNRIISIDISRADPEPTNWTAQVVVEYVNHVGGIDRTNLPYKCYLPHVWAEDSRKLFDRDLAEHATSN